MAGRVALIIALLFACVSVGFSVWVDCADHASCTSCVDYDSTLGTCEWCQVDTKCHEPGSIYNPCGSGNNPPSVRNASNCQPLPPCPTGVNPGIYNERDAYDMITFSLAAYNANPATFPNFPSGTKVNVTFTGTVPVGPQTQVNGFTATYGNRIVVAFQGTASAEQLITEMLNAEAVPFKGFGPTVSVADYFLAGYEVLEAAATKALIALMKDHPGAEIFVTGHSLGGALASLFALGAYTDQVTSTPPTLYTMGQPRTGSPGYAALHLEKIPNSFRLVNNRDPVPHLPPEGPGSSSVSEAADWSTIEDKDEKEAGNEAGDENWTLERERERDRHAQQMRTTALELRSAAQNATAQKNTTGVKLSRSGRPVRGLLWAYHHGWEIWYPGGEYQNSVLCGFRFCCDRPIGEAADCSDSLTFDCGGLYQFCVGDHHAYFLVVPNGFCNPISSSREGLPLIARRG